MFGAGSDTVGRLANLKLLALGRLLMVPTQTAAVLPFVIMAAAHHPHLQARVQAQLDKVVGRDRRMHSDIRKISQVALLTPIIVPAFTDQTGLSEVRAFVQETYRWRPATPLGRPATTSVKLFVRSLIYLCTGVPHRTTKDVLWVSYLLSNATHQTI